MGLIDAVCCYKNKMRFLLLILLISSSKSQYLFKTEALAVKNALKCRLRHCRQYR